DCRARHHRLHAPLPGQEPARHEPEHRELPHPRPDRQHDLHRGGGPGSAYRGKRRGLMADLPAQVASILGVTPTRVRPLTGGCIVDVSRVDLPDGRSIVAKSAGPRGTLDLEGWMLAYLTEHSSLPVPRVLHSSPSLLLIEHIDGESHFSA